MELLQNHGETLLLYFKLFEMYIVYKNIKMNHSLVLAVGYLFINVELEPWTSRSHAVPTLITLPAPV